MNFKNLTDLFNYFQNEEICKEYLANQRWNGKPVCPHCGSENVYTTNRGYKCANKECHKKFSVTVGTIIENSKVPLRTWFAAIYLFTSSKKGVSSLQLSRQLGLTQKTAWFVLHRIREMLKDKAPVMLKDEIQIDETYVGGKEKNKHKSKKLNPKAGVEGKIPVLGLIDKHGKVATYVLPAVTADIVTPLMVETVDSNVTIVTDAHKAYRLLKNDFTHIVVKHKEGEYKNGRFHTNSIENYWSILKRGIYGVYHQVSPKHLHRYCNEFSGRFNSRDIADNARFELTVQNSEGRLKYQQLISNKPTRK